MKPQAASAYLHLSGGTGMDAEVLNGYDIEDLTALPTDERG